MLLVVGFWHLLNYSGTDEPRNAFTTRLIVIALATFFFLSGYFVGGYEAAASWASVRAFYAKRLLRTYPLYFVSLLAFLPLRLIGPLTFVKAAFLVSMLCKPAPLTLWFMTLLLLLYLVTPGIALALDRGGLKRSVAALVAVYVLVYAYSYVTHLLDERLLLYSPVFVLGVVVARKRLTGSVAASPWLWLGIFVAGIALSFVPAGPALHAVLEVPLATGAAYCLWRGFDRLSVTSRRVSRAIWSLSYASYCMYLFHRPIYVAISAIWLPERLSLRIVYLCLVGLPIIAVVSFWLQRGYDAWARCGRKSRRGLRRQGPA